MLTLGYLKEAITYDEETGKFFWSEDRPVSHFKSYSNWMTYKTRWSGREVGHKYYDKKSDIWYLHVRLSGRLYLGHRLAWFYMYGVFPDQIIDHINGDGLDNRWANLREVNRETNGRNCRLSKNNTSGVNGVWWNKVNSKWVAEGHYTSCGKNYKVSLGSYVLIEDAINARKMWESSQKNFTDRHGKPENLVV